MYLPLYFTRARASSSHWIALLSCTLHNPRPPCNIGLSGLSGLWGLSGLLGLWGLWGLSHEWVVYSRPAPAIPIYKHTYTYITIHIHIYMSRAIRVIRAIRVVRVIRDLTRSYIWERDATSRSQDTCPQPRVYQGLSGVIITGLSGWVIRVGYQGY